MRGIHADLPIMMTSSQSLLIDRGNLTRLDGGKKMEECDLNDSFEFVLFPALQANATERVRNTNYAKAVVNTVARSNGASYP